MRVVRSISYVAIILALALLVIHVPSVVAFFIEAIAVMLLAERLGKATEELSKHLGQTAGALVAATFGNSVELIITFIALFKGMNDVVLASIAGGILANLLLTLGLCMLMAGMDRYVATFSRRRAGLNAVMLFISIAGLSAPALVAVHGGPVRAGHLSVGVSIVFLLVYGLGIVFSMVTHRNLLAPAPESSPSNQHEPGWTVRKATLSVLLVTVLVGVISDELVDSITPLTTELHLSTAFVAMIFVPLIGIAPECLTAIRFARSGKLDASLEIAVGSSLQVGLLIAPLLVVVGALFHHPLALAFPLPQLLSIAGAGVLVNLVSLDGRTHWYEGVMVLAVYLIIAMAFFWS